MANLYQQTFALRLQLPTQRFPTDAQLFGQLDLGRQLAARKFVLSDRFTQRSSTCATRLSGLLSRASDNGSTLAELGFEVFRILVLACARDFPNYTMKR